MNKSKKIFVFWFITSVAIYLISKSYISATIWAGYAIWTLMIGLGFGIAISNKIEELCKEKENE